jgi:hypothetical protein
MLAQIFAALVDVPGEPLTTYYTSRISDARSKGKAAIAAAPVNSKTRIVRYYLTRPNLAMVLAILNGNNFATTIEDVECWSREACGKCVECYNWYPSHCKQPRTVRSTPNQ